MPVLDIKNRLCGGFIHLFPKYKGKWEKCVEYGKQHPQYEDYTYKDFFLQNTHLGIFFSNKDYHPKGFFHRCWYYLGSRYGWLVEYQKGVDENKEFWRECLLDSYNSLPPKMKKKLEVEWKN